MAMKSPIFTVDTLKITKPECFNRQNLEEQMAKMKKMIRSPNNKRKQDGNYGAKTFGVSLDELLNKNSKESDIPQVVERITDYIKYYGIRQEGIFRVNGNMKVIERLKLEFDRVGDADLEESGDVMSVAGLMKMFLRELPEPLIPSHFKTCFIQVYKDYYKDKQECCSRMRRLAEDLPKASKALLKFLCSFLVFVSLHKDVNKMEAKALGIVFAPNMFRSADGIEGFKEQSITNSIVTILIEEYDAIFKSENEESPYLAKCIRVKEAKQNSNPPAMPVPYKEHKRIKQRHTKPSPLSEANETITPYAEFRIGDNNEIMIIDEPKGPQENHIYARVSKAHKEALLNATVFHSSPGEAEPYIRSNSPSWHKPSEEPSSDQSPKLGASSKSRKGIVEKTIKESINEHLFGQNLTSTSEESDKLDSPGEEAPPVPPRSCLLILDETAVRSQKRKKRRGSKSSQDSPKASPSDGEPSDIVDGVAHQSTDSEPKSQDMGSSNHQLIVQVEDYDNPGSVSLKNNQITEVNNITNIDLSSMTRSSDVLSCLTLHRAPPPRKRRPPSLHRSLPSKLEFKVTDFDAKTDAKSLPRKPPSPPPRPNLSPSNSIATTVISKLDARRKQVRATPELVKLAVDKDELDSEASSCTADDLPDSSLSSKKKEHIPVIPPLELYKLAERSEDDPMVSPRERYDSSGFGDAMVSPRSRRATLDIQGVSTECPPSPPAMQEIHFWLDKKQSTSPKGEATMKELTKRSHSLKKKIREFEERFEEENGHKPTHSQDRLPIKKYTTELGRTRKLIQELKEKRNLGERTSGERSPPSTATNKELLLTTVPGTLEQSLEISLNRLKEKRDRSGRPDDIDDMNRDQLQDEKLAVQKALLQHESTFGRPMGKRDKDVMKPLYDRYRVIKRNIATSSLKGRSGSTQPVKIPRKKEESRTQSPERPCDLEITLPNQDSPFGSPSDPNQRLTQSLPAKPNKVKGRKLFEEDTSPVSPLTICVDEPGEDDSTIVVEDVEDEPSLSVKDGEDYKSVDRLSAKDTDAILHQASTQELLEQQASAVKRKRKVRKKLKTFEDNFARTTGRKVQKEDRGVHEGDYEEYKKLKSRLRLLDALITKHQGNNTI